VAAMLAEAIAAVRMEVSLAFELLVAPVVLQAVVAKAAMPAAPGLFEEVAALVVRQRGEEALPAERHAEVLPSPAR